jgi:hypothetical protein
MKFLICINGSIIGSIDVEQAVYANDSALLNVLATAGYVDRNEILDLREDQEGYLDIFEYETNFHRLSLILIQ